MEHLSRIRQLWAKEPRWQELRAFLPNHDGYNQCFSSLVTAHGLYPGSTSWCSLAHGPVSLGMELSFSWGDINKCLLYLSGEKEYFYPNLAKRASKFFGFPYRNVNSGPLTEV